MSAVDGQISVEEKWLSHAQRLLLASVDPVSYNNTKMPQSSLGWDTTHTSKEDSGKNTVIITMVIRPLDDPT